MLAEINQKDIINLVSDTLLNDGIVIIPTDTIYGFSCLPGGKAEKRLREIKGRDAEKHFIKLTLKEFLPELTPETPEKRFMDCWPGPLTLIVPGIKEGTTVGIRIPDNDFLRQILEKTGTSIVSTSVNRSGMPAMNDIGEICSAFGESTDLIVDGGKLPPSAPSTIIDITSRPFRLIRKGALEIEP